MLPICFTDFGCRSLIYTCMIFQKLGKFILEPEQVKSTTKFIWLQTTSGTLNLHKRYKHANN
jgi:hypothetical protein